MSRPEALEHLLEELQEADTDNGVAQHDAAYADILVRGHEPLRLTAAECNAVFDRVSTLRRFVEALGQPDASIELCDLTLSTDVLTELECRFTAVDEI